MGPTLASAGTGIASGLSSMLPFLAMSDIELKENIEPLTELWDGTPVWSYNYIDDPTPQIGLMAQDIEDRVPEAVHDFGDYKAVDYEMATRPARRAFLADAFGLAA
jgi:hypothetical protein